MAEVVKNNVCYNFRNSMYVDIDGEVYPCAYGTPYKEEASEGNITKNTLESIFNNRTGDISLKSFCHSCTTCRLYTNKKPLYDIMFLKIDNLCNFACLSCSKRDSSGFKKYDKTATVVSIFDYIKKNIKFIDKFERIIIVGGEPLISKNVLEFLKLLSKEKEIVIFSNLSVISSLHLSELKHFKLVTFYCSIDDIEALNIRHGFKKEVFFKNFKTLKENSFNMYFNVTLSVLNVLDIVTIFNELKQYVIADKIHFMKCLFPLEYNINILPKNIKTKIKNDFNYILSMCNKNFTGDRTNCFNSIKEIKKIFNNKIKNISLEDTFKKLKEEDKIRNTSFFDRFYKKYEPFIKK